MSKTLNHYSGVHLGLYQCLGLMGYLARLHPNNSSFFSFAVTAVAPRDAAVSPRAKRLFNCNVREATSNQLLRRLDACVGDR